MKHYFLKKKMLAVLFCIGILAYPIMSLPSLLPKLKEFSKTNPASWQDTFSSIDGIINENMAGRYNFIEGYGYLQTILGKHEINHLEVISGADGILYYQEYRKGPKDTSEITKRIQRLSAYEKKKGAETLVLLTPDKYIRGKSELIQGAPYNYANETADAYRKQLTTQNIPVIDFRIALENSDKQIDELVYRSDHHWRIETAFSAFTQLVEEFHSLYHISLDPDNQATNKENYNFITYPASFLGSQGRTSGVSYSGLDDFTYIYPKYPTSFTYEWNYQGTSFTKQGRFEQALTNPKYLQTPAGYDPINDKYSSYLDGNAGIAKIHNEQVQNGLKVLFIKDSYSLPLAAFFSTVCEDVELIDPRYYDGDIEDYIRTNTYTHVFVSFSAQSLDPSFFPFFEAS